MDDERTDGKTARVDVNKTNNRKEVRKSEMKVTELVRRW